MTKEDKQNHDSAIASMTGYGRAVGESQSGRITVEARSLNHRYLEIFIRSPRTALYLDPRLRSLVKTRVSRGKVELHINLEGADDEITLDLEHARHTAMALQEIARQLGDKVRLEHVIAAGEIKAAGEKEMTPESEGQVLDTVEDALDCLVNHRITEGKSLAKDLSGRLKVLSSAVTNIEALAPQVVERIKKQVNEFIESVNLGGLADPQRLELEVALLSQKSDISEEITRLKTHLSAFDMAVSTGGVVGRRLDFLLQEMQREINTIGSKSGLTEISELVVDFKSELEKIREQVQNIE